MNQKNFILGLPTLLLSTILLVPIVVMLVISLENGMISSFFDKSFLLSLFLTISGATVASLACIILGTPAAYSLARGYFKGRMNTLLEALLTSPMTIPHVVAGIALLITFSPISPIHGILNGFTIYQSFAGITLAYFFVSVPIYVSSMKESIERFDVKLELSAQSLGASFGRIFSRIVVPNLRTAIVESFLLAWARSMSEFGSILILAYVVFSPPLFNYVYPAPVYVWNQYETSGLFSGLKYAGALLLISIVMLIILEGIKRRR
ncbi:MAG: ABC transporter permease [Nitrososphaerota archaeon]